MPAAEEIGALIRAEYIPPRALGALAPGRVSGADALTGLATMFAALQGQAMRLTAHGPTAAASIHCRAVAGYLGLARAVFDELKAQGITVVQKLVDMNGQPLGESRGDPISPTTLTGCGGVAQPAVAVEVTLIRGGTITPASQTDVAWPSMLVEATEGSTTWVDRYLECVDRTRKANPAASGASLDAACQGLAPLHPSSAGTPARNPQWRRLAFIAAGGLGGILLVWLLTRPRVQPVADRMEGCPCF